MGGIEFVRPRLRADVPAFVAGTFFAYEDLLGAFSGAVAVRPEWGGPPLNTIALTSERLIAYDVHGATEATAAVALSAVTGVSSPEDAGAGTLICVAPGRELQVTELTPEDAAFVQGIVYHAAAGRLYRAGASEQAGGE